MTIHRARRQRLGDGSDSLDGWLTICGRPIWEVTFVVDAMERVTCPGCRSASEDAAIPPAPTDGGAGALSHEPVVDFSLPPTPSEPYEPEVDFSGCPAIGVLGFHCEHFGPDEAGCCWCGEKYLEPQ